MTNTTPADKGGTSTVKDRKAALLAGATPPPVVTVDPAGIPAELKAKRRWVCWKWEPRKNKWTKPPINARTGHKARSNDPTTWSTFEQARACYQVGKYGVVGIGYVLDADEVGIDLDSAVDSGNILPWAAPIVAGMSTYGELSPTGTGCKLLCRGRKPAEANCRKPFGDGEVEIYDQASPRYFTLTGSRLPDCPTTLEVRTEQVARLCALVFTDPPKVKPEAPPAKTKKPFSATAPPSRPTPPENGYTDEQVLELAFGASNGEEVRALYAGDTSAYGNDPSRADLALCNYLRFWSMGNRAQVDRLFRASKLMRDKWDEKRGNETYGKKTLGKAMPGDVYRPPPPSENGDEDEESSSDNTPSGDEPSAESLVASARRLLENRKHKAQGAAPYENGAPLPENTDLGNGTRLAQAHGNHLRYCHSWKKWLLWNEGRWRPDDTGAAESLAKTTILEMLRNALDEIRRLAKEDQGGM